MTESTLLSVIGVDIRLLEPLRRGSLRGRDLLLLSGVANLQAHGAPKSMFFKFFLLRFWLDLGYPLGYHFG